MSYFLFCALLPDLDVISDADCCAAACGFVRWFPPSRFAENEDPPKEWMDKDDSELPPKEDLIEPKKRPGQTLEEHLHGVETFQHHAEHEVTTIMASV
ncbi:hypothetical protein V5O48_006984 [Marasmius crinis-equi]|uniref:Uncharacterized protein n=1 Tax=Marasmius crinis-equi TaxID=585013 RepID=A0ABR3FIF8_9AGAR